MLGVWYLEAKFSVIVLKLSLNMFRGSFIHQLDSKGRVSLPSLFRQVLVKDRSRLSAEDSEISNKSKKRGFYDEGPFLPDGEVSTKQEELDVCVLTNFICDGARCLEGYTLSEWEKFEAKLTARSRFDPQLKKLENYYLARAVECQVDGNGRIGIPVHLRDYAGLEKEVVFAGSLHGFRVWDKRVWEIIFREAETALLENPSLFMDVDL